MLRRWFLLADICHVRSQLVLLSCLFLALFSPGLFWDIYQSVCSPAQQRAREQREQREQIGEARCSARLSGSHPLRAAARLPVGTSRSHSQPGPRQPRQRPHPAAHTPLCRRGTSCTGHMDMTHILRQRWECSLGERCRQWGAGSGDKRGDQIRSNRNRIQFDQIKSDQIKLNSLNQNKSN